MSRSIGLFSALIVALGLAGCGGGFSTEDAVARCDQERDGRNAGAPPCIDDAAYAECVAAYEECGDDAQFVDGACPLSFSCSDD